MENTALPVTTLHLVAGQVVQLPVREGALLHVRRGALRLLEAPSWLAETVFMPPLPLGEGAVHSLRASGWITLHCDADAIVDRLPAMTTIGPWRRLRIAWSTLIHFPLPAPAPRKL